MIKRKTLISVIILVYRDEKYLQKCINSILATTSSIEYEIVVIDNASLDGCDEIVHQYYPQVRFFQSNKNLGFAKANNTAFNMASGRNLLFINPDTEIKETAIEKLHHQLTTLPNAGIVGAKLLNRDRSIQTSCIQAFPTILNQILDSNALRSYFPRATLWGMGPLFLEDGLPTEVDAISGACLMIKRSVFESVGMFSTDYFMYSEDIDLCFKVRQAGWKNYYVPTAVVIHYVGASSSQSSENSFSRVMMLESRWRFFRKTRSLWYSRLYRLAMFSACIIRIALVLLVWPVRGLNGKGYSIENVLKKWTASLSWTLGGEDWVKNY